MTLLFEPSHSLFTASALFATRHDMDRENVVVVHGVVSLRIPTGQSLPEHTHFKYLQRLDVGRRPHGDDARRVDLCGG
jgi:hypothetical protein